jgi:hypothetical protein
LKSTQFDNYLNQISNPLELLFHFWSAFVFIDHYYFILQILLISIDNIELIYDHIDIGILFRLS